MTDLDDLNRMGERPADAAEVECAARLDDV
jgi:hypothetical protein